jgi:hypothetical protein
VCLSSEIVPIIYAGGFDACIVLNIPTLATMGSAAARQVAMRMSYSTSSRLVDDEGLDGFRDGGGRE